MQKVTYPRACPKSGKKNKNSGNLARYKKYCGTNTPREECPQCTKTYSRKDDFKKHIKQVYKNTGVKRKAEDDAELLPLELLHSTNIRTLKNMQQGGSLTTRGMKRKTEDDKNNVKVPKPEIAEMPDTSNEYGGGPDPLYVAKVKKLGPAKRRKKNTVVNQKFILHLEQQRGPMATEDLNIRAPHAIPVAVDKIIEANNIPNLYTMALQIGSRSM